MTSSQTYQQTIRTIMSIVDDHKDDVSEFEYLRICDTLKTIYNREETAPANTTANAIRQRVGYYEQHIPFTSPIDIPHPTPVVNRNIRSTLENLIVSYQRDLQKIQNRSIQIPTTFLLNVSNDMRIEVLRAKCAELNIDVPVIPGHTRSGPLVTKIQKVLIENGVSMAALKREYYALRIEKSYDAYYEHIQNEILSMQANLAMLD
jgi:hypothetical protein